MGGGYALLLACTAKQIKATVVFYGRNPSPIEAVTDIQSPVLFFYGEEDRMIRGGVPRLEEAMRRHGKGIETKSYPDAGHSFMNHTRGGYRREAAEDAWTRTIGFYNQRLKR